MRLNKLLISSLIITGIISVGFGAAFQSLEQSAVTMGTANAGTAVTTDPSIQYYNPAGMAFVKHPEVGISGIVVQTSGTITPIRLTGFDGRTITGNSNGPGVTNLVPAIYFIKPIDKKLAFGIGMEAPFGLETKYPKNSIARYFAVESKIVSINLNPAFSYKVDSHFAVGAGLIFNYTDIDLSQVIDGKGALNFPPFLPQPGDVLIQNNASGEALGWDAGIYLKPTTKTDIGLSYHSKMIQDVSGSTSLRGDTFTLQQLFNLAGIQNARVTATLDLPAYTTLSLSHAMTHRWKVMADVQYNQWSDLKSATLNFSGNAPNVIPMPSQTIDFDYNNTWRFAVGQSYQAKKDLVFRMGVAYDETPIPRDTLRTARLPTSNRFWVSVGGTYDINKHSDISFAYAHVFVEHSKVDSTNGLASYVATYSGDADLVGVQYNVSFV